MRGEASRLSDRHSRDTLAPKLRSMGEENWRIGEELFGLTDVLDHTPRLEDALTNLSRSIEDKVAVVHRLIDGKVHPMTMEIMCEVVSKKWSKPYDIANAVEDFGVDAFMYYADVKGATLEVSIELAQLHSALLNLPVVRSKLYDVKADPEARVRLLRKVLTGKDFSPITMVLAEHATRNLRRRRFLTTIQWLIAKFSRHMQESLVTVTTAVPLTQDQVQRLVSLYTKKLGRVVHIDSIVDPTILGGIRVQVDHEVTDNTVVRQLETLRRSFARSGVV